jgi:hypothetical protein
MRLVTNSNYESIRASKVDLRHIGSNFDAFGFDIGIGGRHALESNNLLRDISRTASGSSHDKCDDDGP